MRYLLVLVLTVALVGCGTSRSSSTVIGPASLKPGTMAFGSSLTRKGVAGEQSSFAMSDSLFYAAHLKQPVVQDGHLVLLFTGPQGYQNQVKIVVPRSGTTLTANAPVSISNQLTVTGKWNASLFAGNLSGPLLASGSFTVHS